MRCSLESKWCKWRSAERTLDCGTHRLWLAYPVLCLWFLGVRSSEKPKESTSHTRILCLVRAREISDFFLNQCRRQLASLHCTSVLRGQIFRKIATKPFIREMANTPRLTSVQHRLSGGETGSPCRSACRLCALRTGPWWDVSSEVLPQREPSALSSFPIYFASDIKRHVLFKCSLCSTFLYMLSIAVAVWPFFFSWNTNFWIPFYS